MANLSKSSDEELLASVQEALFRLALPGDARHSEPNAVDALDELYNRVNILRHNIQAISIQAIFMQEQMQQMQKELDQIKGLEI